MACDLAAAGAGGWWRPVPTLPASWSRSSAFPRDRLAVIPPGIAPVFPSAAKIRDGQVPVIGTGGPLEEASGMMIFLEAARLVIDAGHDVEFVIASHGKRNKSCSATTRSDFGSPTASRWPTIRASGAEFWCVLDIYCQPAVVASTGRTLIQALGHAIPCIATDVQGLRALIDPGENGLIVAPGDAAALQTALIDVLDHPEEARRLGARALERARDHFDPDVEADRLTDVYRMACS